jgi:hypothetical protein
MRMIKRGEDLRFTLESLKAFPIRGKHVR